MWRNFANQKSPHRNINSLTKKKPSYLFYEVFSRCSNYKADSDLCNFHFLKTWMYIAIPVSLYTGERIFRAIRSCLYEVNVLKVILF